MPDAWSDEQLLRRFASGRTEALGELARRYEAALLGLARGILGTDRELAGDVVQESWLRVIRFAGRFNGDSSVKTWLYRIVINQSRTAAASRSKSPALPDAPADVGTTGIDPALERSEARARLRNVVAALPEDRRLVVLLCYHANMTHEQAAEILKLPLGTLKSRLHAALEELRRVLKPESTP